MDKSVVVFVPYPYQRIDKKTWTTDYLISCQMDDARIAYCGGGCQLVNGVCFEMGPCGVTIHSQDVFVARRFWTMDSVHTATCVQRKRWTVFLMEHTIASATTCHV